MGAAPVMGAGDCDLREMGRWGGAGRSPDGVDTDGGHREGGRVRHAGQGVPPTRNMPQR